MLSKIDIFLNYLFYGTIFLKSSSSGLIYLVSARFSLRRISMRLTAMLTSGVRIRPAILLIGGTLITVLVPAQLPTKVDFSTSLVINGYGY